MSRISCSFFILIITIISLVSPAYAVIEFNISDSQVNNQEISLIASISGLTSNSCFENRCFLRGLLRKVNNSKYFGQTQNNSGSWIDYISSLEKEYIQSSFFSFQPNSGSWSGQLNLRFLIDDTEYKGPADYELKLQRFSGNSTGAAGESNILLLALTAPTPTPSPTITQTSTPSPTTTSTPVPTSTPTPSPKPSNTPTASPSSILTKINSQILGASDSAISTPTATPIYEEEYKNTPPTIKSFPNWPFYLSSFLIFVPAILLFKRHRH